MNWWDMVEIATKFLEVATKLKEDFGGFEGLYSSSIIVEGEKKMVFICYPSVCSLVLV
jgi:hypothetical protein